LPNKKQDLESGQSIILVAMLFLVLSAFVGLAVDVSVMMLRKASMQNATDAAAVAAVGHLCDGYGYATVALSARQFIALNGYSELVEGIDFTLTVNILPSDTPVPPEPTVLPTSTYTPSATPDGGWFLTATPLPTWTPTASPDQYVEVIVDRQAPLFFLRAVLREDSVALSARAVAACNNLRIRIAE